MSNDYGKNAPLSYNKYLRVPELIDLQTCLSSPAHHDELLFITVHQAYELWFKQILHEIDAAIGLMKEDHPAEAAQALRRVVEIEKLLIAQIHLLETMRPISFLAFRDELNPASGFQSMQFREIEFSSGLKDDAVLRSFAQDDFARKRLETRMKAPSLSEAFFALLRRRGFDTPASDAPRDEKERRSNHGKRQRAMCEVLTHPDQLGPEYQLAEGLLEHDEYFSLWRSHHIKMVRFSRPRAIALVKS
jgi:tryptophan 2,3-dioxygenase